MRGWILWRQPRYLIAYVVVIEVAAVMLTAALATSTVVAQRDAVLAVVLAVLGSLQAELGRPVERARRRVDGDLQVDMTSVWTFAGVLLLPPVLVAALVTALYGLAAVRQWNHPRKPLFRTAFNTCLVVLTCYAAQAVLELGGVAGMADVPAGGWRTTGVVVLAAAAYFVVGALLVVPGLDLRPGSAARLLGSATDNLVELATLCLGMVAALLLATIPLLVVAVLPPLVLLHRTVLVKQLELAATTDGKTGLLNTAAWYGLAADELARAGAGRLGVLMIDLDHFKRVNDTFGHLAGDTVLGAVAATVSEAVGRRGSVGRFGGEEFVVLLPDADGDGVRAAAERIRTAIAALHVEVTCAEESGTRVVTGLSGSIGIATYPDAGPAVEELVQAADAALYRAKAAGRNRVVSSHDAA